MSICQRKYVLDLLEETGTLGCKPASSPMEQNVDWWDNATALLEDAGIYRRLVGKLIFLTVTRPDIYYAVSILSQFMQAPRTIHLEGVYRLLAYLKRAPGKGLLYRRQGHLHIEAYSDSGFAGDKEDRKSHGGYATYVRGNLVTWRSQKQSIVSRYTTYRYRSRVSSYGGYHGRNAAATLSSHRAWLPARRAYTDVLR